MKLTDIETAANTINLMVMGVTGRIVLLGPKEPGFWKMFQTSPEWLDGLADPMDRWSSRAIGALAKELGATPKFPFGDPPAPFLTWAMDSHAAWQSPVGMLVHANAGLMVSYRGALEFDTAIAVSEKSKPCNACQQECTTACPIGALGPQGYDVAACKLYLETDLGSDCLHKGCKVRRSCPVSQTYGRDVDQSGFHMKQFLSN